MNHLHETARLSILGIFQTDIKKPLTNVSGLFNGVPKGVRTPVTAVKGRCPRPLDDGD